jgi:hypothetical protein
MGAGCSSKVDVVLNVTAPVPSAPIAIKPAAVLLQDLPWLDKETEQIQLICNQLTPHIVGIIADYFQSASSIPILKYDLSGTMMWYIESSSEWIKVDTSIIPCCTETAVWRGAKQQQMRLLCSKTKLVFYDDPCNVTITDMKTGDSYTVCVATLGSSCSSRGLTVALAHDQISLYIMSTSYDMTSKTNTIVFGRYNLNTNKWFLLKSPTKVGFRIHFSLACSPNSVFLVGGCCTAERDCFSYDIASEEWKAIAPLPEYLACALCNNYWFDAPLLWHKGFVLFVMGFVNSQGHRSRCLQVYNVETNRWCEHEIQCAFASDLASVSLTGMNYLANGHILLHWNSSSSPSTSSQGLLKVKEFLDHAIPCGTSMGPHLVVQ